MTTSSPSLPEGIRLYAVGDVHGRLDLLKQLLAKIDEDAKTAKGPVKKIFLGDYIDRGLHSCQIIDYLIDWRAKEKEPPIFLMGNHEQVMRQLLRDSDPGLLGDWFQFGGRETLLSYGLSPAKLTENPTEVLKEMASKVPPAHVDFLENLELSATYGDYFFCHAGVRPGVALESQNEQDLVWIRYEFLNHKDSFGKVVVHGHTITFEAEFCPNRISIDTGAYATGCLTALALEGTKQWLIQTA
ncbi:MAG: metallophosphoesterase family protein [Alphaproteobacteria bacterium]|nr:metallophosphoesterase family protein [Alphaproteobacteria bacterium]